MWLEWSEGEGRGSRRGQVKEGHVCHDGNVGCHLGWEGKLRALGR